MTPIEITRLLESHPVATFAVDKTGKVTVWNAAIAALTGRTPAEVIGQRPWKGFGARRIPLPLDEAWLSGEPADAAFSFTDAAGRAVHATFRVRPGLDPEGEVTGALCTLEPAAAAGSDHVATAATSSTTAFMVIDREFMIRWVNPATEALLRQHEAAFRKVMPAFDASRILGTCIDSFHRNPQHQRTMIADPRRTSIDSGFQVGGVVIRIHVVPVRTPSGDFDGAVLEWQDVSEAAATKAVVQAVERAQAMIEFTPDGTIVSANAVFLGIMGYSLEEVVGKHHRMFVDPTYAASAEYQAFWDRLRRGEFDAREFTRRTKTGKEIALRAAYMPILDAYGKPLRIVKLATDMPEARARAEAYAAEMNRVVGAARRGDLSVRGDERAVEGDYRAMIRGINEVIEAMVSPIAEVRERLGRVAQGDLTARVTGQYSGDHALLQQALNDTLDALNEVLGQVRSTATEIASGSSQVASAAQSLSDGATRQAAAVEEISASITQMTEQTRSNAENATQASHLAAQAGQHAQAGDDRMRAMVRAMSEIEEASQNISKIIKVIDEIAFQTNLLALNAAVEAARAGVHGKGFAVVAEEVRNLAARSASAAKETTALIEGSIKKVAHGTQIAQETATALARIVEGVTKATDLVAEIAAASAEQARGIAQVDQGLRQVDQVTQQNTAAAEESAAASDELSAQATRLREMLERFVLASATSADPLQGLPPEVLAAIQQLVARGVVSAAPPAARPAHPPSRAPARRAHGVDPAAVLPLGDAEFGRY